MANLSKAKRNRLLVYGMLMGVSVPGAEFGALSPWGHPLLAIWKGLAVLVALVAFAAVIVETFELLVAMVRRRELNDRLNVLGGRVAFFMFLAAGISALGSVRDVQFEMLSHRSEPTFAAIDRYTSTQGAPPPKLAALVPDYLPEVPTTGMAAYPDYVYSFPGRYDNAWSIEVYTSGGMDPDIFLYLPNANYEDINHGKWRRIGAWAYIVD